jgi:hypothetical protein
MVHRTHTDPWLERDTADAKEIRYRTISNIVCERPGGQLRVTNIT